ncbi:MAG: hypothetical protein Kow0037_06740 [Calditrichia bacterium]
MNGKQLPQTYSDSPFRVRTLLQELLTDLLLSLGIGGIVFREYYLWRPFIASPEGCLALALISGMVLFRYGWAKTGFTLAALGLLMPDGLNYLEVTLWHYTHLAVSLLSFFIFRHYQLGQKLRLPENRIIQYTVGLGIVNGLIWVLPIIFSSFPGNDIPVGLFPFLGIILGFSEEVFRQSNNPID